METMPTNEQTAEHLKKIGKRLVGMEFFLLTIADTQAQQFKLIASRIESFTPEEDARLRAAAQRGLDSCRRMMPLHKQFEQDVEAFSRL
jgi:hypothetical protein